MTPQHASQSAQSAAYLPACLQPDFAQVLDRNRPHELLPVMVNGKAVDPKRSGNLRYRYADTGETVLVPNIWYNQTQKMRIDAWQYEVRRTNENLMQAKNRLAELQSLVRRQPDDRALRRALDNAKWDVQSRKTIAESAKQALQAVTSGKQLL